MVRGRTANVGSAGEVAGWGEFGPRFEIVLAKTAFPKIFPEKRDFRTILRSRVVS